MAIDIHARLRNSHSRTLKLIDKMAAEAIEDLEIMLGMYQIRADYEWLLASIKAMFPLGVTTWIDRNLVEKYAESQGLSHLVDAIIVELNDDPCGPAVIPSRAAIIMRNDEALTF